MQAQGAHLRVTGLQKTFEHGGRVLPVLRGVEMEVRPGELVAIVGASGAGKSTLLHILGTLDTPTAGTIFFGEQEVTRLSATQLAAFRNQHIGFVFQFHHLLPEFSALENVMMPALIGRVAKDKAEEASRAILDRVGLSARLTHRPAELSGGEQQRVALARALVQSPPLLLADEPTGNLDSATGSEVHALLASLCRERNMTIILVTHNSDLAGRADRVLHMIDGQIREPSAATDQASSPA